MWEGLLQRWASIVAAAQRIKWGRRLIVALIVVVLIGAALAVGFVARGCDHLKEPVKVESPAEWALGEIEDASMAATEGGEY